MGGCWRSWQFFKQSSEKDKLSAMYVNVMPYHEKGAKHVKFGGFCLEIKAQAVELTRAD